jgi:hypothetical protein
MIMSTEDLGAPTENRHNALHIKYLLYSNWWKTEVVKEIGCKMDLV